MDNEHTQHPGGEAAVPATPEETDYKRLYEAAHRELETVKTESAKRVEAAEANAKTHEATAKAFAAENLRRKVAAEHGVPSDAFEFLAGDEETALRESARKLVSLTERAPVQAGTVTNPPAHQPPSVDDQVNAALRHGHTTEAIRLKRQQAFGPK